MKMRLFLLLVYSALAAASPFPQHRDPVKCPIIFDGRIPRSFDRTSFNYANVSLYSAQYVKGENLTWSEIILLPKTTASRFDTPGVHRPLEVTINDKSLFRTGQGVQNGFRRAGLLLKNDKNDPGADAADKGVVTFHWSVKQDPSKPMNLSHEYMNVWHEKADYSGNQFSFVGGVVLKVDGGTGVETPQEKGSWKIQDAKNNFVFRTPILKNGIWQNFAIQLDYVNDTVQVFYSAGTKPLQEATVPLPNANSGGGQLQLGMAKKPTETETVVWDGYQEPMPKSEGQIYGGVFVEDSTGGCISR